MTRTKDEIEEIVESFEYELLNVYFDKNSNRRIVIRSSEGYLWDGFIVGLMRSPTNIRFFDKHNYFVLKNISLWLKKNRPEFSLCEGNIYEDAKKRLKFFHNISKCQEEFWMTWDDISHKRGCAVCHGLQVGKRTSLAHLRPDLEKEWHWDNDFGPEEITVGSSRKAYWICFKCGYGENKEWFVSPNSRTNGKGRGCPACSGSVVSDRNRLSITHPKIASEWDYDKNEDTPDDVSYGSEEKRWWICHDKKHSYPSSIKDRTGRKSGCPICNNSKGESIILSWILDNDSTLRNIGIIGYVPQKSFADCRNKNPLEFDFGLEFQDNSWFMIEYHGPQHYGPVDFAGRGIEWAKEEFKKNKKRDKIKVKYCKDNEIPLLVIPYWEIDNVERILKNELAPQ